MKTRLIGDLTAAQAAALHAAFLEDLLDRLRAGDFELRIAWALEPEEAIPAGPWPGLRQEGSDLGERLYRALHDAAQEAGAVAALGSDHPTLPLEMVHRAFETVESGADVVLGPAEDGGYYLIALRAGAVAPRLFAEIAWSTDQVLAATLDRCRELGLTRRAAARGVGRRHPRGPAPAGRAHGGRRSRLPPHPSPPRLPGLPPFANPKSKIQNGRGCGMRILTAEAMREVDRAAIEELGIPSMVLMENAAIGVVEAIAEAYEEAESAAIFCGPGNNGGDGLAVARHLSVRGWEVRIFLVTNSHELSTDAAAQLAICRKIELPILEIAAREGAARRHGGGGGLRRCGRRPVRHRPRPAARRAVRPRGGGDQRAAASPAWRSTCRAVSRAASRGRSACT